MLVFSLTHSLWLWMMGICSLRCISEPVTWFDIRVTGRHGCVNYLIFHHARGYQSGWSVIIRGGGGEEEAAKAEFGGCSFGLL